MFGLPVSRQLPTLQQEIKDAAWRQITASGAASLSVEGLARQLGIASEEVGIYFPGINDLVTAMLIDAHASFGDYQISARDSFPGVGQFLQRFMATCLAYREWAIRYPERYMLLFGPPVPGCETPLGILRPFMMRSISPLVGVIRELRGAKLLNVEAMPLLEPSALEGYFWGVSAMSIEELLVHTLAMVIRSRLHGMVSLEISGHFPHSGEGASSLYEYEIKSIVRHFIDI
ncbi:MAG: WHG domain-containing protein [Chlorobiaceae bacterium]|nr:WHG domain-containing protein [Chlorobiaceae bacterium]